MKSYLAFTLLLMSASTTFAMLPEKTEAKEKFWERSHALHQQYVYQRPDQMAQGTLAYEQLRNNTQRLVNAYKKLEDLGQDTQDTHATRAELTNHFQQLRNIIRANLPPEARANGL